ncbi:MAG: hypothetical protein JWM23_1096 [Microbacteriaceae bacterium]|nr:hypothetical protein [Microbacteriaceae bacterium]
MTARLPAVLSTVDLPLAELSSASLDGELYPLGESWCPVDAPAGAESRALSIASVLPGRVIIERMTAAWIYGAAPEPVRYQLCADTTNRVNLPFSARYSLREVVGVAGDTISVAGLQVTVPARTVLDLCRDASIATADVVPVIRRLFELGLADAGDAARRLARTQRQPSRERLAAAIRLVPPAESCFSARELPAQPAVSSEKVTLVATTRAH